MALGGPIEARAPDTRQPPNDMGVDGHLRGFNGHFPDNLQFGANGRQTLPPTEEIRLFGRLHIDLDQWIDYYNNERTHQGKVCQGRTPMQTLIDGKPKAMLLRSSQHERDIELVLRPIRDFRID